MDNLTWKSVAGLALGLGVLFATVYVIGKGWQAGTKTA